MSDILAGFVLAAGSGTRLRPLTNVRPKALCPVGNRPLLDLALERVEAAVGTGSGRVAVNAHHRADQIEAHVGDRAHVSVEPVEARGTAGALGFAAGWLDGRAALVTNADAWTDADLGALVEGWDGRTVRVLLHGDTDLTPTSGLVASLLPGHVVAGLPATPAGLYETTLRPAQVAGDLEVLTHEGAFVDCGTPADYLAANLAASGGSSVVHPDADVRGRVTRSVVWDTGWVADGEHLEDAIRIGRRLTVLVR